MATENVMHQNTVTVGVDEVDGRKRHQFLKQDKSRHTSGGTDSAYGSDAEGEASHLDHQSGKKKTKKSKKPSMASALIQSLHHMNIAVKDNNIGPGYDLDSSYDKQRWTSGSSEGSSSESSTTSDQIEPCEDLSTPSLGFPLIDNFLVRIQSENCRKGDCLLRMGSQLKDVPKKYGNVFKIEFGGCIDDKNTTLKWCNCGTGSLENIEFRMKAPEKMPEEPTPSPEPPMEDEEEPSPQEPYFEEERKSDRVDAPIRCQNTDEEFPYRLAIMKGCGEEPRIVAVQEKYAEEFETQWKVVQYNGAFTLKDPAEHKETADDLHVAVTDSKPEPFFVREGDYWDSLQNPMVKLAIFGSDLKVKISTDINLNR